jgi:hypothetical protein
MKTKYPFFLFPAAISRDSPSHHFDGSVTLCSPFAELMANFVQHPTVPLWPTKTPKLPMKIINTTIGLRVSFLFVCEIAVQCLDFSRSLCLCRLSRFKRAINNYRSDNKPQGFQSRCRRSRWTCLCCYTGGRRSLRRGTPDSP